MAQFFQVHPVNPQPRLIRQAATILREGGVIAYPTDSGYALGCRLDDAIAARRIRDIRKLGDQHHLTLVLNDLSAIGHFARLDNWQFRIVRQGTPGCFTFLLPATREVPRRLQHPKRSTVGVRVPDHPVVRALLADLGEPILSSTLILPGATEALADAEAIRDALERQLDLVIDAGACPAAPTTVIDLAVQPPAVVRLGAGEPARLGLPSAEGP
ncbi:MAG: threonylcarbamoyl-AMP synthase [Betaproteobacteria bacterium]|jgi:tRNA threonylcarbamoyl adenosine modification protein (Sua5/YciO/YrdC/YwlC family)|nr:threonylcarbamoyl-AMP synthase [Betaproteobacteria bacterium]MBK7079277.1 threonylcarbamoyl-AMP synthase [Betaproteobacteria bacterium]MBK7590398.1 threonylcarbamoyl-AMP synthase [Betaproteobacteria bacterium]MBK7745195.1 threonylcarbamoyl-AMP synthase [Betaproteobacteria bacterium]MBK8689580.1 threonylcarbamoyl-AMP synthase [Betaproteobacteria bacterium]